MFFGEHIEKIKGKRVNIPYELGDSPCEVLCLQEKGFEVFVAIFPADVTDAKKSYKCCDVLERKKVVVKGSVELPQAFLDCMNGKTKVAVIGVHDRIEIVKVRMPRKTENLDDILGELKKMLDGKEL